MHYCIRAQMNCKYCDSFGQCNRSSAMPCPYQEPPVAYGTSVIPAAPVSSLPDEFVINGITYVRKDKQ